MFILTANLLTSSKIADGLFESSRYLLGGVRGGLGLITIVIAVAFSATIGVVGAGVVTMGMLALPTLLRVGYKPELATGVVVASGSLGILFPPSIMLFTMGALTGVSVARLSIAVIIPGLVLASCYMLYTFVICQIRPELGPAMSPEETAEMPKKKWIISALVGLLPPVILIVGVLGSIFFGIATPTEASAIGAVVAFLLTILYRKCSWQMVRTALLDTMKTTAMIFMLIFAASAFTSIFFAIGGAHMIVNFVTTLDLSRWLVFAFMCIVVFTLGLFLDWFGVVMIVLPIFMPIMDMYGFDRLWVVVVMSVLMQTCFLTPPFGLAIFYLKQIAPEHNAGMMFRSAFPFILIIIVVTVLCIVFPQLVTFLPGRMW